MKLDQSHSSSLQPMLIIGGLFFMFGFVTWLNGSLIPFLQIACELNHLQAYFVTLVFYIAYTVMALPMSYILKRTGFKNGMVLGLLVMVLGSLLFIPAALVRAYPLFLLALFVLGTGLTILQTASNPFIVLIGPEKSAAVRISVMGVLNKSAGVVAPLVFTALVLGDVTQFAQLDLETMSAAERSQALDQLAAKLVYPYLTMAGILLVLAAFIRLSPLPEPDMGSEGEKSTGGRAFLRYPQVILGAITLFFYVGVEVIAGDTIGLFGRHIGVSNFSELTAYTMSFMVIGYILGMLLIPRLISQEVALSASAIIGMLLVPLAVHASGESTVLWDSLFAWIPATPVPNAVLFIALFGLANALVWPAVWPLALRDVPAHFVNQASAILIMGIAGGAILPLIYGAIADSSKGPQFAYWIMLPGYLVILLFALKGHRVRRVQRAPRTE